MHVLHVCHFVDLGPAFIGWAADVEGAVTCIVTPRVHDDEAVRNQARELLHRAGADPEPCSSACPNALPPREG
jgi:hypothetical protein